MQQPIQKTPTNVGPETSTDMGRRPTCLKGIDSSSETIKLRKSSGAENFVILICRVDSVQSLLTCSYAPCKEIRPRKAWLRELRGAPLYQSELLLARSYDI